MTFLEKFKKQHPGYQEGQIERAVSGLCPEDVGYEDKSPCGCLVGYRGEAAENACRQCWEREAET